MKQFQKYGVAAAVATVASGAAAQMMSPNETGDMAIVPYYTVNDGKNTGIHIINTTASTQVVKVRLRRGSDSKDALDFNLVMSPYDEWTANIGAGGANGVVVNTNDNTCTVPAFPEGGAEMPDTYADGATEGYVEIIAMGQPVDNPLSGIPAELQHLPLTATHVDGVPLSCDLVRENFYRVASGDVLDEAVRGTHTSNVTSTGFCTGLAAPLTAVCSGFGPGTLGGVDQNTTAFGNSDDNALKVSYFITDSDGGLEIGDNAVHITGFSDSPMLTNQELLNFGTTGELAYDPLNFELPNMAYGAWPSQTTARNSGLGASSATITNGSMLDGARDAMDADNIINDWASFSTDDGTVATDWVVTLPGQYTMNNPICDVYDAYALAGDTCTYGATGAISSAAALDEDELPLTLASTTTSNPLSGTSNLSIFDREEALQNPEDPTVETDLGFSPGGSAGTPTGTFELLREVNVITFNEASVLGSAALQDEENGLRFDVTVPDADRGWADLAIEIDQAGMRWDVACEMTDDGDVIDPNSATCVASDGYGTFVAVGDPDNTAVIGFAAWERNFADQAGNYGRMVEHSTQSSR